MGWSLGVKGVCPRLVPKGVRGIGMCYGITPTFGITFVEFGNVTGFVLAV